MGAVAEPCGYASPVLEFCKQVFDPVALLVYGFTVYCGEFSLCSWRNTGGNATLNQGRTIGVAVVTFVAQKRARSRQVRWQCCAPLWPDCCPSVSNSSTGRISPSQTACGLEFSPPLVWPIARGTSSFYQTASRAVRYEVVGVDHQAIRRTIFGNQRSENIVKNAYLGPTYDPFTQSFMWSINIRCILPMQSVSDHVDDAVDNFAVIDTRHPM